MRFIFQQPSNPNHLDAINAAANGAISGGSMYAFATREGIRALLDAPHLKRHLESGRAYHLIVGLDAITNGAALLALEEAITEFRGALTAQAFLHNLQGTFHPKFTWFRTPNELRLITGSGNLTPAGLGTTATPRTGNWEAHFEQTLTGNDADTAIQTIQNWIALHNQSGELRAISDVTVRDRAMSNGQMRFTARRPAVGAPAPLPVAPVGIAAARPAPRGILPAPTNDVFVRELPRNRLGQADIGQRGLQFLGYLAAPINIFLQHVRLDNSLENTTEQRIFVNASQNYRVELPPIVEHGYEIDDLDRRMIFVAVKLNEGAFRYTVIPVTHPEYHPVSAILGDIQQRRGRSMRVRETTSAALRTAWPTAPSNLLPVEAFSPEA